jgi:hypothetical protein
MIQEHTKLSDIGDEIVKKSAELTNAREKVRNARQNVMTTRMHLQKCEHDETDASNEYTKILDELKVLTDQEVSANAKT